jgi:signal transduction histidine kinase
VPGLRVKLALALVATSAVTLAAAVGTLVPPLEHRLDQDRVSGMRELARTSVLALARMPARDLRPGGRGSRRLVHRLARRVGGRVALFDVSGAEVADTDPERIEPRSRTPERFVDAGFARAGDVRQSVSDGEAVVVVRAHTHAGVRTLVLRKSLDDSRAAASVVRGALPVAGGVGLAVAVALGSVLGFGLLRRLEGLRRGARRLAEEGIEQPLDVRAAGRDEVGELAGALELMRARLHAQERGRQAFLSTASHELRTPVASLRGTAELLEEELAGPRPDVEHARVRAAAVSRQAHRLTALADDLLGLGRLDAAIPLVTEPVDLAELAGTLAGEVEPLARAAGVVVRLHSYGAAWALGDPLAVARIIRALLDNALRHGAPPDTELSVTVTTDGQTAAVAVRDAGSGVPEPDRERIFGRFERATARGAAGFGLGLPIARGLARQLGGDVAVTDAVPGARFTLTLPACVSPLAADAWRMSTQQS